MLNIIGATVYFTVKTSNSVADPGEFQLSSDNIAQIDIDDGGNGKARVFVKNVQYSRYGY